MANAIFGNEGFVFVFAAAFGFVAADVPNVPVPDNLDALLRQNGILVVQPRPAGLAKTTAWYDPIKIVVRAGSAGIDAIYDGGRYIGSAVTDGGQYVLDATNVVVNSVANGVQWTASTLGEGVDYVVVQTANATTWTINTGLDGVRIIVRQSAEGVSWTVEKAVPDQVSVGGVTYVRLDRAKNAVKAGVKMTAKIAGGSISAAQSMSEYLIQTGSELAVGAVDMTAGTVELSMDVLTFAANNSTAIASALVDLDANKLAARAWGTLYAAVTNVLNWGDLGWCGSNVGITNKFATNLVVTDY